MLKIYFWTFFYILFLLNNFAIADKKIIIPKPSIQSLIQSSLKLDLNNEQIVKIKAVLESRTEQSNELQGKATNSMETYLKLALKCDTNKALLQKKNKEVENNYQALRDYQLGTWLFIKANLTEQQLKQLSEKQDMAFKKIGEYRKKTIKNL